MCLYAKDIAVNRNGGSGNTCSEDTINDIISSVPDHDEMKQVVATREAQQKFSNDSLFRAGSLKLENELSSIRDALMTKDGLVNTEKQDLFRE